MNIIKIQIDRKRETGDQLEDISRLNELRLQVVEQSPHIFYIEIIKFSRVILHNHS